MVATQNCISKSVLYDPSTSYSFDQHEADDWEDEDATPSGEEWRVFGAADSLKIPEDAHRVRFEFHKGAADFTYMQMDGEPWKQPLPVDNDTTVVELSHHGRVKMVATQNCISKSVLYDPSTSYSFDQHEADDWEDEDATPSGMDAQISYLFHCERKLHPDQSTYAKIGSFLGWMAASYFQSSSK
nr:diacylglycerol kinase 5-like [Tanacetum cinerariifolium]